MNTETLYSEYGNLSVSDPKVASSQVKINENFVKIIFSKLKLKLFLNSYKKTCLELRKFKLGEKVSKE